MEKHELQRRNEQSESEPLAETDEVPSNSPRDPIEPDPMNPVRRPSVGAEPQPGERPDLDWAEHEDLYAKTKGTSMPEKETLERAEHNKREGKAPSTQAGEFVREEMEHVREGKHGARSTKQAIAIGLSKARRAGVKLPAKKGTSKKTQKQAARDMRKGQSATKTKKSAKRSRATSRALKREGRSAASKESLSRQARSVAAKRSAASRSRSAKKAARTRKK